MRSPKLRRLWLFVLCVGVLIAGVAAARVGGGESYGGGGSGGGGGDGGGGDLIAWAIWLAIRHPYIGVPVLGLVIAFLWWKHKMNEKTKQERSIKDAHRTQLAEASRRRKGIQESLERLLKDDPNFSEVLFLDFAQMVYTRYQKSRGSRQLEGIRPYLSDGVFERLADLARRYKPGQLEVDRVIVASIRLKEIDDDEENWFVTCEVEANYTEKTLDEKGKPVAEAWYTRTRVTYLRAKGVLSQGPDRMRTLGCPSCGSPIKHDRSGACAYCGQVVRPGEFHWEMHDFTEIERKPPIQVQLDLSGQEIGTDIPTLRDPQLQLKYKEFQMHYPGESLQRLVDRSREVFVKLQEAWTSGKWEQARAFETDRLFQMHLFWMERYRAQKLRNVIEDIQVQSVEIVKIARDAFLESVVVRIKASMKDYTVGVDGKVAGGNKDTPRVFSEYWTFIRKVGFEAGKDLNTSSCPSCGAPVKVSMHGRCEFCDANLSSGDFDWTLAKIEQDEAYVG